MSGSVDNVGGMSKGFKITLAIILGILLAIFLIGGIGGYMVSQREKDCASRAIGIADRNSYYQVMDGVCYVIVDGKLVRVDMVQKITR